MWCYRRLLTVAWKEKKTNKEIIQMADVGERLLQQLRGNLGMLTLHERQLGTFATAIPRGKIEGKRGKVRPRRNWMDDVKEWSG
ncbi:UDP-glucuronosyltransferase 2A1-like [Elysia marginata]|uniref:UDP-glucuronosyltransferase 2A1-like n=1 Tax=Elysia marginata TaxID=1093978 RepID=A0AAV4HSS0_9GAST|nr:UDP-glucuronosyltransferase 2A1-like [Elysia marginata]